MENESLESGNSEKQSTGRKRAVRRRLLPRIAMLMLIAIVGLYGMSFMANSPDDLGVTNGQLAECPDKPNCVSTQSTDDSKQMDPVGFSGSVDDAIEKLKSEINKLFPRARLISKQEYYLRYEFTSLIFRFVDDVEFWFDVDNKKIHFRSASRVGHSDLGVNRKRMTKIGDHFKDEFTGT